MTSDHFPHSPEGEPDFTDRKDTPADAGDTPGAELDLPPGISEDDIRKAGEALLSMVLNDPRYRDTRLPHPHDGIAQRAGEIAEVHDGVLKDVVERWAEELVDAEFARAVFESAHNDVNEELLPEALGLASTVRGEAIIDWLPDGLMDIGEEKLDVLRDYMAEFVVNPGAPLEISDITDDEQLQSDILRQLDALRLDMGYQAFDTFADDTTHSDGNSLEVHRDTKTSGRLDGFIEMVVGSASKPEVGKAIDAAFDYKRLQVVQALIATGDPKKYRDIVTIINSASSDNARNALGIVAQAFAAERGVNFDAEAKAHEGNR